MRPAEVCREYAERFAVAVEERRGLDGAVAGRGGDPSVRLVFRIFLDIFDDDALAMLQCPAARGVLVRVSKIV